MSHLQSAAIAIACRMRYLDKHERSQDPFANDSNMETEIQESSRKARSTIEGSAGVNTMPAVPEHDKLEDSQESNHFARCVKKHTKWTLDGCAF